MQLEVILSTVGKKYERIETRQNNLKNILKEDFYVEPSFIDVKTESKMSTSNPLFVLFSAPGAVGKTALARHISYYYNALYLNMSQFRIGTNSFIGTIHDDLGIENVAYFINGLKNGSIAVVIDALDEAEVASGRNSIQLFIDEFKSLLPEHSGNNIILLARTETAQFIAQYCVKKGISLLQYEIGLFRENEAKHFIRNYVSNISNKTVRG